MDTTVPASQCVKFSSLLDIPQSAVSGFTAEWKYSGSVGNQRLCDAWSSQNPTTLSVWELCKETEEIEMDSFCTCQVF